MSRRVPPDPKLDQLIGTIPRPGVRHKYLQPNVELEISQWLRNREDGLPQRRIKLCERRLSHSRKVMVRFYDSRVRSSRF